MLARLACARCARAYGVVQRVSLGHCSRRLLCSATSKPPPPPPPPPSPQPPFAVRAALVGISTGMATPFFAVAGVVVGWHRAFGASSGILKLGVGLLLGGGVTTLCVGHVLPFLREHADLVTT